MAFYNVKQITTKTNTFFSDKGIMDHFKVINYSFDEMAFLILILDDDVQEKDTAGAEEEDSDRQVHSGDSEDDEEPTAEDVGFLEEDDVVALPPLPRNRASFLDLEATVAKKKKPSKSSADVPVRAEIGRAHV